jgi:hypothetical protein
MIISLPSRENRSESLIFRTKALPMTFLLTNETCSAWVQKNDRAQQ